MTSNTSTRCSGQPLTEALSRAFVGLGNDARRSRLRGQVGRGARLSLVSRPIYLLPAQREPTVEGAALPQRASNDEATDHSDCYGSCAAECGK